jgi:hypothetical protein
MAAPFSPAIPAGVAGFCILLLFLRLYYNNNKKTGPL